MRTWEQSVEDATLTPAKVDRLQHAYRTMADTYERSGFAYFDGLAHGFEQAIDVLFEQIPEVEEVFEKTHKVRTFVIVTALAGGGYICYKRYKNGILFPWQKSDERD